MSGLKATEQDRLYLSGAIHRMGERTGSAAERILDDLDTLLAENARLRAVAEALKAEGGVGFLLGVEVPALSARLRAAEAEAEAFRACIRQREAAELAALADVDELRAEVRRLREALLEAADNLDGECSGWGDAARAALGET